MENRLPGSKLQGEKILKLRNGGKKILVLAIVVMAAALLFGCTRSNSRQASNDGAIHEGRPYQLASHELSELDAQALNGNCDAAYKVAQHHLYATLDMQMAERYFRLAAKCGRPEALVGLITVLRKPEHDAEIDDLLKSLKIADPTQGEKASQEVALRRAERQPREPNT